MIWEYWAGLGGFLCLIGFFFRSSFPYLGWGVSALFISLLTYHNVFHSGVRGDYPAFMLFIAAAVILFVVNEQKSR